MEVFRAGFNSLRGLLPYDIYNVPTLREISLPANHLNSQIGDRVVQLSNLTILYLSANELTGELPQNIGKLSKLQYLHLHINNLTGPLPSSLMNCSNLIALILRVNFLEGDISTLNFSKLKSLRKFDLGFNHLTGNLPKSLFMCKSLVAIRLSSNNLVGEIPPSVSGLQSLTYMSLSNNSLTNITGAITSLMGIKNLTVIIISRNFFQETLPNVPNIVNMNGFMNTKVLALGGCRITEEIPTWIRTLKELQILDLSNNQLTGPIPGWLGTLPNLFYLDLSNNLLSGEFIKDLCNLKALTTKHATQQVKQFFLAELPVVVIPHSGSPFLEYTSFSFMPPTVNLRQNSLSGIIPAEIGQLKLLHVLDLSINNFTGSIPNQISDLIDLERLDLSENQLSGTIPSSLKGLHFLSWFSVANNNLAGEIPQGTQLHSFPASSYLGNPGLCGFPISRKCSSRAYDKEHDSSEEESGFEFPWLYVIAGFGYAKGLLTVCVTLLFHTSWRNAYFNFLTDITGNCYTKLRYNVCILTMRLQETKRRPKRSHP